ncbi:MAG: hypothetical protein ACI9SC_001775 [Gammaproteobacteria bacterium]
MLDSKVISEKVVTTIVSADTEASIIALIIENAQYQPEPVRGVRIDLKNKNSSDQIYLDEKELVRSMHELNKLDCSVEMLRNKEEANKGIAGIGRCRPSNEAQAYCPDYRFWPNEALNLSTHGGHKFTFVSVRPSVFAETIDKVLRAFNIDDKIPARKNIELPAEELERLFASVVRIRPELASSSGFKLAQYGSRGKKSVTAIFWPYKRSGGMGHSYYVECQLKDEIQNNWTCDTVMRRGYLKLPYQDFEVVIIGALEPDKALALIDFATIKLQDERKDIDYDRFNIVSIFPPSELMELEFYEVDWSNGVEESFSVSVRDGVGDASDDFELVKVLSYKQPVCGKNSY